MKQLDNGATPGKIVIVPIEADTQNDEYKDKSLYAVNIIKEK